MRTDELTMLLARIQVIDNRQVDQLTIQAWTPLMEDVTYADAVAAVNTHFRTSTAYLQPAHIVQGIRESKRPAIPATMSEERAECAPDAHRRMSDGTCLHCTHREES